jgi:hypothetical protein
VATQSKIEAGNPDVPGDEEWASTKGGGSLVGVGRGRSEIWGKLLKGAASKIGEGANTAVVEWPVEENAHSFGSGDLLGQLITHLDRRLSFVQIERYEGNYVGYAKSGVDSEVANEIKLAVDLVQEGSNIAHQGLASINQSENAAIMEDVAVAVSQTFTRELL